MQPGTHFYAVKTLTHFYAVKIMTHFYAMGVPRPAAVALLVAVMILILAIPVLIGMAAARLVRRPSA